MTFGANARRTHSSTYSKWPLKRTLFPHYVYPEPDSRREDRRRSIATAWHVRDVISRPAPGIRIVLAITEGSEVEFWILARPFGTRVTRRRKTGDEGEGEGMSRDVRQKGGKEGRCEKPGFVAYLRNSGCARSFMKYPIYPEGRVKFLTGRSTFQGILRRAYRLDLNMSVTKEDVTLDISHAWRSRLKRKYLTHKWICIIIDPLYIYIAV